MADVELIDRKALGIGKCNPDAFPLENLPYVKGWNGAIELLEAAPVVDAVPVVRCRDCKHYRQGTCWMHSTGTNYKDLSAAVPMEPDDYCSYGERK